MENVATAPRLMTTREVAVAGLIAALLCASAWVAIPIGPVPITLQVFGVLLATVLLRPISAGASVGTYLLLGAIGVPVFAQGTAGLGVLFGPTGGYLWGFLLGAVVGSAAAGAIRRVTSSTLADTTGAAIAVAAVYAIGWYVLNAVTGMGAAKAFAAGVAPFIAVDVAKAVVAIGVAQALRRAGAVE